MSSADITDEQQLLVTEAWIERWPKPLQTTFKVWLSNKSNKTVSLFISNLSAFCGEARIAKGNAEKFNWTVSPNELTCCYQGYKKRNNDDAVSNNGIVMIPFVITIITIRKTKAINEIKPIYVDPAKQLHNPGMTTSVANSATGYGILVTLVPSWHPNANKDSKVPFESSKKGMAYVSAHTKHFKYLDSNDTDGNPLKNVPRDFKQPDAPKSKPASSTSSGQSGKNKKKGKFSHDKHSVALSSYFANLISAIDLSDISNTPKSIAGSRSAK